MSKPDRDATLNMQLAGCSDRESYHRYLTNILHKERSASSLKTGVDKEKITEIVKEFRAGRIDENTVQYRLLNDANYPAWMGSDQLFQTKHYLEWQSKLEKHNKRKHDFINTLPQNEQLKAGEWLSNKKYLFDGESKSIGNYINEQLDTGNINITDYGVNGYNLGKYGYLFAKHLIESLQKEVDNNKISNKEPLQENKHEILQFQPYGAWSDFNTRLSLQERERINKESLSILEIAGDEAISEIGKAVLRRYSGFGSISAKDERGVLYDYYTSPPVAHLVWQLLEKLGKINSGANILEPSCGTGVFFNYAPKDKSLNFTGVELD
jgi:hypothetical protein